MNLKYIEIKDIIKKYIFPLKTEKKTINRRIIYL